MQLSFILALTFTFLFTNIYTADHNSISSWNIDTRLVPHEHKYDAFNNRTQLTEVIVSNLHDDNDSDNQYISDDKNDCFYYLEELPTEIIKKILTMAILEPPKITTKFPTKDMTLKEGAILLLIKTATALSCVCKPWNQYVNDDVMTPTIVEHMNNNNFDIFWLKTTGRKKHFPDPADTKGEIEAYNKKLELSCNIIKGSCGVLFATALWGGILGGFAYSISGNTMAWIAIPAVFVYHATVMPCIMSKKCRPSNREQRAFINDSDSSSDIHGNGE